MCEPISVKLPNIKFHEILFSCSHVVTSRQIDEQTDMVKLIGAVLQISIANTQCIDRFVMMDSTENVLRCTTQSKIVKVR
jgi:hypothetical protein